MYDANFVEFLNLNSFLINVCVNGLISVNHGDKNHNQSYYLKPYSQKQYFLRNRY